MRLQMQAQGVRQALCYKEVQVLRGAYSRTQTQFHQPKRTETFFYHPIQGTLPRSQAALCLPGYGMLRQAQPRGSQHHQRGGDQIGG